jgi:hypothetical protein
MIRNSFFMFVLCVPLSIVGMNELTIREYYAACRGIDKAHAEESRNFRRKMMMSGTQKDLVTFKKKLKEYKEHINIVRKEVLRDFKESCQIDDRAWRKCVRSGILIALLNQQNMLANTVTMPIDAEFPKSAYVRIAKRLKERKISPNRVQFACSVDSAFFYGVTPSTHEHHIGCLTISVDAWKKASSTKKHFVSMCMVEELIEPLSIITQLIGERWPFLMASPELRYNIIKLQNKARVLSVLRVSVKNAKNASLAKKYALSMVNSYFSPNDYAFISAVEWYWRVLEYLVDCF